MCAVKKKENEFDGDIYRKQVAANYTLIDLIQFPLIDVKWCEANVKWNIFFNAAAILHEIDRIWYHWS